MEVECGHVGGGACGAVYAAFRSVNRPASRSASGTYQIDGARRGAFNLLGARHSVLSDLNTCGAKYRTFLRDSLRLTVRNAALSIGPVCYALCCLLCCVVFAGECACLEPASAADSAAGATKFAVGFGKRDITPPPGLAMWGFKPADLAPPPQGLKTTERH
jgi:hypothetical protein